MPDIYTGSIACSCGNRTFTKVENITSTEKKLITITNIKCTKCKRETFHSKFTVAKLELIPMEDNHENASQNT